MLILLLLLAAAYFFSGSIAFLAALSVVILLPLFSLAFFLLSTRGISLELKLPPIITDKRDNELLLVFHSARKIAVPRACCEIEAQSSLSSSTQRLKLRAAALCNEDSIDCRLSGLHTGRLSIAVKEVRLMDFLGLFQKQLELPPAAGCLIYPQVFPVILRELPQSGIAEDSSLYSQHRPGNANTEIFALHEYTAGDDLRKIHWKLSAKSEEIMVRDFSLPLSHSVTVLLELSLQDNTEQTLSHCIDTLFSLSAQLLEQGVRHSVAWYDAASKQLLCRIVSDTASLSQALPLILTATAAAEQAAALNAFNADILKAGTTHLCYIAASADIAALSNTARELSLRLLLTKPQELPSLPFEAIIIQDFQAAQYI